MRQFTYELPGWRIRPMIQHAANPYVNGSVTAT